MSDFDARREAARTDSGRFGTQERSDPEATLTSAAVLPMTDAPTTGEVISALFEGEWYSVYWSETANDMSPYGTPGWAMEEDDLLMLDLEGWRPVAEGEERFIDRVAERAEYEAERELEREDTAREELRAQRKASRERTARNRAFLELEYERLSGAPAPKMTMHRLRGEVRALHREWTKRQLAELFSGIR